MNCADARGKLLDALDGLLAGEDLGALNEHLRACPTCRAEFEGLERASAALQESVAELAPEERYLTAERWGRLMAAYSEGPKLFKLITYRRFVPIAAAAAILISAVTIAVNIAWMRRSAGERRPETVAVRPEAPGYVPVVLAASGHGEPLNVVRSIPVGLEAWPLGDEGAQGARLVRTDTAGVRVPVDNALYDPEESSRWW